MTDPSTTFLVFQDRCVAQCFWIEAIVVTLLCSYVQNSSCPLGTVIKPKFTDRLMRFGGTCCIFVKVMDSKRGSQLVCVKVGCRHRWGQVTRVCPGKWQMPQDRGFLAAGGRFIVASPVIFLTFFPPSPPLLNPPPKPPNRGKQRSNPT